MSEYSLSQITALIDPSCFPDSASSGTKYALINKARELVYNSRSGEIWLGTQGTLQIVIVLQPDGKTQTVTLPLGFETLEGVYDSGGLQGIRNQWFSFTRMPPTTPTYGRQLDDLGFFCGVTDLPSAGSTITVKTTTNEAGALHITFFGADVNGIGFNEQLTIPTIAGNTVTTANTFYSITQVIVSTTAGALVVSLGSLFFARYQPGETYPQYRRYRLNQKENDATIYAIAKRSYVPLLYDNAPMDINNVVALENALRAYQYQQAVDFSHAASAMAECISLLNGELARYQGDTSLGVMQLEPATAAGKIWNLL